jgi:hypothetical protein
MKPDIPADLEVLMAIRAALLTRPLLLDAVVQAIQEDIDQAAEVKRIQERYADLDRIR